MSKINEKKLQNYLFSIIGELEYLRHSKGDIPYKLDYLRTLLAETFEETEPVPVKEEKADKIVEMVRKDLTPASEEIKVGDEVWIPATIFCSLDGNNVGVRVLDTNGTGWGIRISKKLIRKKE